MAQDHSVDVRRIEGEAVPIARFLPAPALYQAAVEQQLLVADTHDVARARDLSRRAVELDLHDKVAALCVPAAF